MQHLLPMTHSAERQNGGFFPWNCAATLQVENPGISVKQAPPDLQL